VAAFAAALRAKADSARRELAVLDEAAASETKSSAGDKYETSREMFSQARELHRRSLTEAETGLDWLARFGPDTPRAKTGNGALVGTDRGWFLLCPVPIAVETRGTMVQGMSSTSPLGTALVGLAPGMTAVFRDQVYRILSVS
jgi:hypothetical protein